jgi:hypothetical protein
MAKRLGGSLLGFGVKSAGEFCMSYECAARRGARERAISYINTYTLVYLSWLVSSGGSQVSVVRACTASETLTVRTAKSQGSSTTTISLTWNNRNASES